MHQPVMFREDRIDVLQGLMRAHPFATLVTEVAGEITADHLPVMLCGEPEETVLRAHVAAANPLSVLEGGTANVLVIFQGPQSYVSPTWYPAKKEHAKVVPTWNYAVVHARGSMRLHRDTDWLMAHLQDLSDKLEAGRPEPWQVTDAPESYVSRQLRALIGLEIAVTSITGNWKVSQNKSNADRAGVVSGLMQETTDDAAAMACLVSAAKD